MGHLPWSPMGWGLVFSLDSFLDIVKGPQLPGFGDLELGETTGHWNLLSSWVRGRFKDDGRACVNFTETIQFFKVFKVSVDDDSLVDPLRCYGRCPHDQSNPRHLGPTLDHGHAFLLRNLRRRNWKSWWPGMTRGAVDLFDTWDGFHWFVCFHFKISRWCSNDLGLKMVGFHTRKMMTPRSTMDFCATLSLRQTHFSICSYGNRMNREILKLDLVGWWAAWMCFVAHDLERFSTFHRKNHMASISPCVRLWEHVHASLSLLCTYIYIYLIV